MWGGVFVAAAILGLIAHEHPSTSDWTSCVIPILLIVAALNFTRVVYGAGPRPGPGGRHCR